MRHIIHIYTLIVLLCAGFSSCSDTDTVYYGNVYFHKTGLFADIEGTFPKTMTTTFAVKNVAYLELDEDVDLPTGWSAEIDFYKGLITVTVTEEARAAAEAALLNPTEDDPEDGRVEEILFEGETHDGYTVTASLTVGVVDFIDFTEFTQANSMIVTTPGVFYTFNPTFRGEKSNNSNIVGVDDCELLWKSYVTRLLHVQLVDSNKAGFYVAYDMGDYDDDGDYTQLVPGNAVIAAHDASDNILWSWHIWVTTSEPTTISFNGVDNFMDRNLGADLNVIESGYDDTDDILLSYGLYYQWGRKDPFIQPVDYQTSGSIDAFMTDHDGNLVTIDYEESTSSIGKVSYAIKNPLTYIVSRDYPMLGLLDLNSADFDWIYSAHNGNLWSDTEKSIYDPSPYGWRVPKSTTFEGVTIYNIPSSYDYVYGADLSDGSNVYGFMGCGFRNYIDGSIDNLNSQWAPWSGYYWTSGGSDTEYTSKCLLFSNENLIKNEGGENTPILTSTPMPRSTGMQIRCIKNE